MLVIQTVYYVKSKQNKNIAIVKALCDCGKIKTSKFNSLSMGKVKSCGCYRKSFRPNLTHGMSKTRTYRIWRHMINRCHLENHPRFSEWGGRGIKVCDRWRYSFENFWEDMGEAKGNLSIDRINNQKGYSKENCRWATLEQQAQNKRKCWDWGIVKRKTYAFRFMINKKNYYSSGFHSIEEAIQARDKRYAEVETKQKEIFGIV
jgi:hypothetical protein